MVRCCRGPFRPIVVCVVLAVCVAVSLHMGALLTGGCALAGVARNETEINVVAQKPKLLLLVSVCATSTKYSPEFCEASLSNHERYGEKEGISVVRYSKHGEIEPGISPKWNKMVYLLRNFDSAQWLMWIDSDAIVRHCLAGMNGWAQRTVLDAPPEVDLLYGSDGNTGLFFIRTTAWSKLFLQTMLSMRHDVEAAPNHCTPWHWLQDFIRRPKRCNPGYVRDQLAFRWARVDPTLCFDQHAREIPTLQAGAWLDYGVGVATVPDHIHDASKLQVQNVSRVFTGRPELTMHTPVAHLVMCNHIGHQAGASCFPHLQALIQWAEAECRWRDATGRL